MVETHVYKIGSKQSRLSLPEEINEEGPYRKKTKDSPNTSELVRPLPALRRGFVFRRKEEDEVGACFALAINRPSDLPSSSH